MTRSIFTWPRFLLATRVVAVVIALATTLFWWRSYYYSNRITYSTHAGASFTVGTDPGSLSIQWQDLSLEGTPPPGHVYSAFGRRPEVSAFFLHGHNPQPDEISWVLRRIFGPPIQHRAFAGIAVEWQDAAPGGPASTAQFHSLFGSREHVSLQVPFWLLQIAASLPLIFWAVRAARNHRRNREGTCKSCGYDLRATPHRCPECGTPAAPANSLTTHRSQTTTKNTTPPSPAPRQ